MSQFVRIVKGTIAALALACSTVIGFTLMMPFALLKLLLPFKPVRRVFDAVINGIGESWIGVNNALIRVFTRMDWRIEGVEQMRRDDWYLVLSNHQSWVDILVLQYVCNQRIPFLKFFLKSQLIWVPLLGLA